MSRLAWALVAVVTGLRAAAAFTVPMTGDEAYYWEWSRHLALGYVDHPPMVAWLIAAFAWLGRTPGAVRIGFILCGVAAAWAAADCATTLARSRAAGTVAALAVTLAPLCSLAFASATPDGPYLAFTCLTLAAAARAFTVPARRAFVLLGLALGAALLSRLFALALAGGLAAAALAPGARPLWRRGLWLSFALGALLYAPFLWWNATHAWATFVFALAQRHENIDPVSVVRPFALFGLALAAFSPGLWLGAVAAAARPRSALLAWTALPLLLVLAALAVKESVEVYWLEGSYVTLAIASGVAFVHLSRPARAWWAVLGVAPAVLLLAALFTAALAPGPVYALLRAHGMRLRHTGPFEIYTFPALAQDVVHLVRAAPGTVVMTDGYGFSSLLDFNADITPVVIGYDVQGQESRRWYSDDHAPRRALFVDKESLYRNPGRPDFQRQLAMACARVRPGPTLVVPSYPGVPARPYYTTWCDDMQPHALRILRWEAQGTARGERPFS